METRLGFQYLEMQHGVWLEWFQSPFSIFGAAKIDSTHMLLTTLKKYADFCPKFPYFQIAICQNCKQSFGRLLEVDK